MVEQKLYPASTIHMEQFEKLISPMYSDLYTFVLSIVKKQDLAEDITQETLMISFKNLYQLQNPSKLKTWIFTIAKREALKVLRTRHSELLIELSNIENILRNELYDNTHKLSEDIIEIIDKLDLKNRRIIELVYYSDLSLKETATILNMNYNTIKSKHSRIKKKIFTELQRNL